MQRPRDDVAERRAGRFNVAQSLGGGTDPDAGIGAREQPLVDRQHLRGASINPDVFSGGLLFLDLLDVCVVSPRPLIYGQGRELVEEVRKSRRNLPLHHKTCRHALVPNVPPIPEAAFRAETAAVLAAVWPVMVRRELSLTGSLPQCS